MESRGKDGHAAPPFSAGSPSANRVLLPCRGRVQYDNEQEESKQLWTKSCVSTRLIQKPTEGYELNRGFMPAVVHGVQLLRAFRLPSACSRLGDTPGAIVIHLGFVRGGNISREARTDVFSVFLGLVFADVRGGGSVWVLRMHTCARLLP